MRSSESGTDASEPTVEELYEDAPCGYVTIAADGTVACMNRTLLRALAVDAEAVVGRPFEALLTPGSRLYHSTHWGPLLALQDEVREVPVDLVRSDGSRLTTLLSAVVKRDAGGALQSVRASLFDASDRRRYERELVAARDGERAVRELGQRAVEGMDSSTLCDEAVRLLRRRLQTDDVAISLGMEDPTPSDDDCDRLIHVSLGRAGDPVGTVTARRGHGFERAERDFAHAVGLVVGSAIAREQVERRAHRRAWEDATTGLPNELALQEAIDEAAAEPGTGFTVCLLDLVGFRLLNESRGHRAGDALLRQVGALLVSQAPPGSLAGRVGADEFVVIAHGSTSEGALADIVTEALAAPIPVAGTTYRTSASMGTVRVDVPGAQPDRSVIMDARIAMHHAKATGQPSQSYRSEMRERSETRMKIEEDLAIAVREGQLRVHYQPVVSLDDGRVASMEALVRWEHPERGLIPPGAFIPIAEETDLICDLGEVVLYEATRQLAEWRDAGVVGPDVSVAVNVSARQFARPGFAATVGDALERAGLARMPHLLELEITETMLMAPGSDAERALTRLADVGVGLSLDDFGTGVSSLARLKRLPVDTLKIDRAFIADLGRSDEDEAIVAAILALADKLGIRVVAEGAETVEQLELLSALGCDRVQGFVFSRPLPATAFATYLEAPVELARAA